MGFMEAIKTVLNNYVNFKDRSRRSEYWWWTLAVFIGNIVTFAIGAAAGAGDLLTNLFSLLVFIPGLAVSFRRMHDIGKSAWWLLIVLIPLIGWLALIYFFVQPSEGSNQYGDGPLKAAA